MKGFQTALNTNAVSGNAYGIQTALMCSFVVSESPKMRFKDWLYVLWDPAMGMHSLLGRKMEDRGNMNGMQTAIINGVAGSMNGLQTGLFYNLAGSMNGVQLVVCENAVAGDVNGIQIAGAFNRSAGNMAGFQGAMFRNSVVGSMSGIQLSVFSNSSAEMKGIQIAAANVQSFFHEESVSTGVQIGLINYSESIRGVQIGLSNWARRMVGVQIGIVNIIQDNPVPVLPLFNVSTSF